MENKELMHKSQSFIATLNLLIVEKMEQNLVAFNYLKELNDRIKKVKEHFQPTIDAAHNAHKLAIAARDEILDPLAEAKEGLTLKMANYANEEKRKAGERARIEKETADQIERERLANIAEMQKAAGFLEKAKITVTQIKQVDTPAPFIPKTETAPGQSFIEYWSAEIENKSKIPLDFLLPDMVRLNQIARQTKGQTTIPGVKFVSHMVPRESGKR